MEGERVSSGLVRTSIFLRFLFFLPLLTNIQGQTPDSNPDCPIQTSSCGRIRISYPFLLAETKKNCSDKRWYEITCQGNNTAVFDIGSEKYNVGNIFYENKTLWLVDDDLASSDCPISGNSFPEQVNVGNLHLTSSATVAFLNCSVEFKREKYFRLHCINESQGFCYFHVGSNQLSDSPKNCRPYAFVPVNGQLPNDGSLDSVKKLLQMGFELSWSQDQNQLQNPSEYRPISPYNYYDYITISKAASITESVIGYYITVRTLLGVLHLLAVIIFVIYRKVRSKYGKKKLLDNHPSLGSSRYSYPEIKKITENFKEKLGQGGYGAVFKGKLPNGQLVAVKIMDSSKGDGQDFISEVTTIGRINHVNVVQLIGFCLEGSRSALVYEFMPNGSLDKYIFSDDDSHRSQRIGWEKLYEIALGVAHGIEYLHRGCEMRILHFDIKPHNILLDENFNPKVSDFGLAKLFSADHSVVSISNARGTAGYIAPELFSTKFGGVSYKSDVYSFGMLLLEMAGRRKNFHPLVERVSQIYFPTWVYDELNLGRDLEIGTTTEGEKDIAKKLVIIGLWCIQMQPNDRPSMSRVVEMLEQNSEELEMPPKPYLASPERQPIEDISLTESDTEALLV